MLRLQ